jgi:hypothetical protein
MQLTSKYYNLQSMHHRVLLEQLHYFMQFVLQ